MNPVTPSPSPIARNVNFANPANSPRGNGVGNAHSPFNQVARNLAQRLENAASPPRAIQARQLTEADFHTPTRQAGNFFAQQDMPNSPPHLLRVARSNPFNVHAAPAQPTRPNRPQPDPAAFLTPSRNNEDLPFFPMLETPRNQNRTPPNL